MMKKILFCAALALTFAACTSDPQEPAGETAVTTPEKPLTGREAVMRDFAGKGLQADDYYGRATRGMEKLMVHYRKAGEMIDGFDNPEYTMDQDCNVVFTYDENGVTYEKRFNLADLEHRNGKMSLEADNGDDIKFPGFRIGTADGSSSVGIYKDGKLMTSDNEWYIVLADRKAVEASAPNMVNIINVCQEMRREMKE